MRKYIIIENELDTAVQFVVQFEGEFKPKEKGWGGYSEDSDKIVAYLMENGCTSEESVLESYNWFPMYDEDFENIPTL